MSCLWPHPSHKFRTCLKMSFNVLINVPMFFLEMFQGELCHYIARYSCHRHFFRLRNNLAPTMRFDIEDSDPPDPRLLSHLNKCFIVLTSEVNWKKQKSHEKLLAISENFKEYPLFVMVIHKSRESKFGFHRNLEYPIVELSTNEV